ncbi:hypothetical protein ACRQ5Q_42180 (plasmid) [Bradyrhizobium sp. PMVTL-01]|uniref:hypothetical protein n=1 Tax=Bradyrhizobium sp. PMVTL-01 TaxID=3434999 RepID=UPI003F72FE67
MSQHQPYIAFNLGPIKLIESINGQNQGDPEQWRHLAGGGSLPDVGICSLNVAGQSEMIEADEDVAGIDQRFGDGVRLQVALDAVREGAFCADAS